jgi:hypothetical protein
MISVVIFTANRPDLLRTALGSVQRQTELASIGEVIVSENGGNRASEQVCLDFSALPIRYIYRDPPLADHLSQLLRDAKYEYVAILFDDDWWGPNHIQNGLRHLSGKSDISCYYSAYFMVRGEACALQCHPTLEFWAASEFSSFEDHWKLTLKDTAVACLVDVPCTFASMIAPAKYLKQAWAEVIKSGNKYDTDRTLAVELAQLGPILVNPVPEVFVRFHPGQDKNRYSPAQITQFKKNSLMHLLDACKKNGFKLGAELDLRLTSAGDNEVGAVCDAILNNYECVVTEHLVESKALLQRWEDRQRHRRRGPVGRMVKKLTKHVPSALVAGVRKVLQPKR